MDDVGSALSSIPSLALQHWMFFVVSFVLGLVGQVFKTNVWTVENTAKGRFFYWMRPLLPLHAPCTGMLLGLALVAFWGSAAPAGPGVSGTGAVVLYYMGAGALSSYVFNAIQHFAQSRGLDPLRATLPPGEVEDVPDSQPPLPVGDRNKLTHKV